MTLLDCIHELGMTIDEFAQTINVPSIDIAALVLGGTVSPHLVVLVRQALQAEGLYWDGK
jgi:plasmid maintenance system antidote protein VapI